MKRPRLSQKRKAIFRSDRGEAVGNSILYEEKENSIIVLEYRFMEKFNETKWSS